MYNKHEEKPSRPNCPKEDVLFPKTLYHYLRISKHVWSMSPHAKVILLQPFISALTYLTQAPYSPP